MKLSSSEEAREETTLIPATSTGSNVGVDEGLRKLLWFHVNTEKRNELARCQAWKPTAQNTDSAALLPVYLHEARATERSARGEAREEKNVK